jgi:hypothetical protein
MAEPALEMQKRRSDALLRTDTRLLNTIYVLDGSMGWIFVPFVKTIAPFLEPQTSGWKTTETTWEIHR